MRRGFPCRVAGLAAGVLLATPVLAQQPTTREAPQATEAALKPIERFQGKTTLRMKTGTTTEINVAVRTWVLRPGEKVSRFPEQGFMIVQLLGGKVTALIDGKEEKHKTGDFWTVRAGSSMSLMLDSESATLEAITVNP